MCQSPFSGEKNKKNISKCRLLKFLPSVLSTKMHKKGVIIKAGSKGRRSGPKVGRKFGQSNNNTKLAHIGMKFGT